MDQILRKRAITAFFFVLIVLAMLILSNTSRNLLFAAVGIFSLHELYRMAGIKALKIWTGLILLFAVYMVCWNYTFASTTHLATAAVLCAIHIAIAIDLFGSRRSMQLPTITGLLYPAGASALVLMDTRLNADQNLVMWTSVITFIWVADTFAYLTGRKFGKRKLNEKLSPNKTWEGFYGGGAASLILAFVWFASSGDHSLWYWLGLATAVWIGGVCGDLCQSSVKRHFNVKDSGRILPGHGGIFDRFDSLIFVIPFVYLISILFQS